MAYSQGLRLLVAALPLAIERTIFALESLKGGRKDDNVSLVLERFGKHMRDIIDWDEFYFFIVGFLRDRFPGEGTTDTVYVFLLSTSTKLIELSFCKNPTIDDVTATIESLKTIIESCEGAKIALNGDS